MKHDAAEILQKIKESGIHCSVCENDDGVKYRCYINENNPYGSGISFCAPTYAQAAEGIAQLAIEEFPNSEFAKWWREANECK